jgi:hypothetical protein
MKVPRGSAIGYAAVTLASAIALYLVIGVVVAQFLPGR